MSAPPPIPAYAPGTFARFTVERRLPKILADARSVVDARERSDSRWSLLESGLRSGGRIDLGLFSAPTPFWERELARVAGARWDELSFFELEFLFYRAIDSIATTLRPSFDVFESARRAALADALPRVAEACAALGARSTFDAVLSGALAGNEADLSQLARPDAQTSRAILLDERAELQRTLETTRGGTVIILADNAGSELCFDLLLVDHLLGGEGRVIELQLKPGPMFVSDALVGDVKGALRAFLGEPRLNAVGERLERALEQDRLRLTAPPDWGEPRHMDALSPALVASLETAVAVIAKGDLNSRRFFEDRAWEADTPVNIASVASNMRAFAVRVLKSDCVVGLSAQEAARLFASDPSWRSGGKYSMIHRVDRSET